MIYTIIIRNGTIGEVISNLLASWWLYSVEIIHRINNKFSSSLLTDCFATDAFGVGSAQ